MKSVLQKFRVSLLTIIPIFLFAEWPTEINSTVDFPGIVYGGFLSDGRGGAWVAGENYFGEIFLTRITRTGEFIAPEWIPIGGLYDGQFSTGMFMSEDSCLIIAFCQYEYIEDIINPKGYAYVQKIDLNGTKLWSDGGVLVSSEQSAFTAGALNGIPRICTDQQGGAYASWLDYRNHDGLFPSIYSQHVVSNGNTEWQDGGKCILYYIDDEWVDIFATPDSQFVTGASYRNEQRYMYFMVDDSGDTLYQLDHLEGRRGNLKAIDSDYNYYYQDTYSDDGIFIHKFSRDGNALWGENGAFVTADSMRGFIRSTFVDDDGGYFISWNFQGAPFPHRGPYFQWVGSNGETFFDEPQQASSINRPFSFFQSDSNIVLMLGQSKPPCRIQALI
ncbi:MAG: hypothetical protein HQ507_03435 [Candidatus Marinimicrobia bacterium]|nr:hypothetical protein [Candidatus Neomarinimicrobiota bacterium]